MIALRSFLARSKGKFNFNFFNFLILVQLIIHSLDWGFLLCSLKLIIHRNHPRHKRLLALPQQLPARPKQLTVPRLLLARQKRKCNVFYFCNSRPTHYLLTKLALLLVLVDPLLVARLVLHIKLHILLLDWQSVIHITHTFSCGLSTPISSSSIRSLQVGASTRSTGVLDRYKLQIK